MGRSDWQGFASNPTQWMNETKDARPLLRQILTEPPIQVAGVHLSRFGTGWQEWPKFQTCKKLESHIKFQGTCTVVVTHDGSVQLLPPAPSPSPHISPRPPAFSTPFLCFLFLNVLTTMAPAIAFLNFAPTPFALYFPLIIFLIVCFLFFLMFFPIFPWHLPDFLQSIAFPFFSMSKASTTSSILPTEHFQHLVLRTFTTLFLNFFYHNVSTRKCFPQLLSLILHSHTSQ